MVFLGTIGVVVDVVTLVEKHLDDVVEEHLDDEVEHGVEKHEAGVVVITLVDEYFCSSGHPRAASAGCVSSMRRSVWAQAVVEVRSTHRNRMPTPAHWRVHCVVRPWRSLNKDQHLV